MFWNSGGASGQYSNNEYIDKIVSCSSGYINLVVNYLNTELNQDYLTIYEGASYSGSHLYRGSGTYTSNVWSTSRSKTSLYLYFTSNSISVGDGYEIVWSCNLFFVALMPCAAGTYSNATGASSFSTCLACSTGTYSMAGSSSCSTCPEGYYSPNTTSCIACYAGSYNADSASTTCNLCPAGKYSNTLGAVSALTCIDCPLGTFSLSGSSMCTLCPPGSYSNVTASSACISCSAGLYSNIAGAISAVACTSCPVGVYCPLATSSPIQYIYDRYFRF